MGMQRGSWNEQTASLLGSRLGCLPYRLRHRATLLGKPEVGGGMDVHMTTPLDTYQAAMQRAISRTARYPQGGGSGKVSVSFDYLGGKVYNVKADHPSGSKLLDGEALKAVIDANLPQTPDALKGITHFVVGICFGSNNFCGHTQTVIQVVNDPGTTPAANR
jgi:hypothetical protein